MAAMSGMPQFASLYVGDLHRDVTEAMLYEIFNSVGPVASIRVCRDSVTRRSLGYAYVNFHQVSDAERALDTLNYSSIKGRSCRIMWSQRDPSLRKNGAGNVFVKNLDASIDNKALYDTFSLFGNILSCKVATDANGKSRGYGFVHYETEEAAKQAIEKVIGMQIGEKIVYVSQFLKRNERTKPTITTFKNLYVKNFPQEWEESSMTEMFEKFGTITSAAILTDKKGRKFGFVNYEESDSAAAAVAELHGKDMRTDEEKENKVGEGEEEQGPDGPSYLLYVQRAQTKAERQAELKDKFGVDEKAPPAKSQQGVNLYVKNLDENTDDASLRALFEPFGTITSVAAMKDDHEKCKGFGFVCFASPDEATKAVTEMHLKVVKGKPLYVGLAEKREARQERLRQRYSPSVGGPPGGKGGKGGCKGGGGMMPQMYGGQQMMGGFPGMMQGGGGMMMGGMQGGMMGPSARPQGMQGGGGGGGMMYPPVPPQMMAGKGCGGMSGPRGAMPPQMMGMMGGKGMTGPMQGKGGMQMGGMPMMGMMGGMMRPPMAMQGQMGGMRPVNPMQGGPGAQGGSGMPQQPQQQGSSQGGTGSGPLTASALAAAPPPVQKQMLGEKLYPAIARFQPELAGKITGMMLEMDNSELLMLLESEAQLRSKVEEALRVLQSASK